MSMRTLFTLAKPRLALIRILACIALLAALFAATASCASKQVPSDGTLGSTMSTDQTATDTTNSLVESTDVGTRPWWFIGDTLTPGIAWPRGGPDPVRAALDILFAGPSPADTAFGATTAIASNAFINSLVVGDDGIATVDFTRKFETADTRPQTAQVVYTLTQFSQVKKVRFLIDGEPNGATGVPPVGRADLRVTAAPG